MTRESANNFPMLEVPGWLENHKLPNAVAVVMALNMTSEASRLNLDRNGRDRAR